MTDLWSVPPGNQPEKRRLQMYAIAAAYLHGIFNRKVKITGVPPDAKFVRAFYDHTTERFYIIYEHPSFHEALEGVMMYPSVLTVTVYNDEDPEP